MEVADLYKAVLERDSAEVVICNLEHIIVYMNPAAIIIYGKDLTGKSIRDCHNANSCEKIDRVIEWFLQNKDNNIVHTYYNEKENKDVYMVALRDDSGKLIGYYEKHEYRNRDTGGLYVMK